MYKRPWKRVGVWMALVVGVLGLSLPRRAYAQLKVGVVDLQAVMEHSVRAKAAKERLQALHDQLQHEIQAKAELKQRQEAELQCLKTALQTHTEASTTQARAAEVEDYRRRRREQQRLILDLTPQVMQLRRFFKKNFLYYDAEAGQIKMSHLGSSG
jgi:Skp family chaperone for outer membrane proteins